MKYLRSILLSLTLLTGISTGASAASPITVTIDGELQQYAQPALIVEGRKLVPMRPIFEKLGAKIGWNQEAQSIVVTTGDTKVELKVGSKIAKVNGVEVELDIEPLLVNEHTLVPVRFVGEVTDSEIDWIEAEQRIAITTQPDAAETDDQVVMSTSASIDQKIVKIEIGKADGTHSTGHAIAIREGLFVTAANLLDGATTAQVVGENGHTYSVQGVVVADKDLDLAVIKTDELTDIVPVQTGSAQFAKTDEPVSVLVADAEQAQAVSGVIRSFEEGAESLSISAELPETTTGAAVVNDQGEVIGILTGQQSEAGHVAAALDPIGSWLTGELAQDFTELSASFPAAQLTLASTEAQGELVTALEAEHHVISTAAGKFTLGNWELQTEDGEIVITSQMDANQYLDYVKNFPKIKSELEMQAESIAQLLTEKLPNQGISLQVLYVKDFAFKPKSFDAEEVENRDGTWWVKHPILSINIGEQSTLSVQP